MIEILKKQLLKFISPLDYHFEKEEIIKNEVVTHYTSYEVIYKLSSLTRKISFSLADYYTHKRVFLFVYNTDGNGHYSLPLDRYLKEYCNIQEDKDVMLLNQYSGETVEQKIDSFFIHIESIVNDRFFRILSGQDWVDISTDWYDYK
jgi:hypothetical protein